VAQKLKEQDKTGLYRLIDANLNRAKEALRVLEDIFRFILKDKKRFSTIRKIRHQITDSAGRRFIHRVVSARDEESDCGKAPHRDEFKRKGIEGIIFANLQRAKESLRVLEETFKLFDKKKSRSFKELRFAIYGLERTIAGKRSSLYNLRQRSNRPA